jgi:1,2-phenylacetyl-CoA epoxidase catalytic subunit
MNVREVALLLGDDLFVQCQTLSPWTVNYVDLEESLAVGSIAQEMLAQGGMLYLFAGLSDADRDDRVFCRPASDWTVSSLSFFPSRHWPDLIAAAYLATQASRATVKALSATSGEATEYLQIVHSEQELHIDHWRKWISLLLNNSETEGEILDSLTRALERTSDLLPIGADHDGIHEEWTGAVTTDIAAWGVKSVDLAPRTKRASGGMQVSQLIDNLRTARSASGQSNYAVY